MQILVTDPPVFSCKNCFAMKRRKLYLRKYKRFCFFSIFRFSPVHPLLTLWLSKGYDPDTVTIRVVGSRFSRPVFNYAHLSTRVSAVTESRTKAQGLSTVRRLLCISINCYCSGRSKYHLYGFVLYALSTVLGLDSLERLVNTRESFAHRVKVESRLNSW